MEDFSVVIIARNEAKTLPRLLESIKNVQDKVILDTGSTDDTIKIAKDAGCNVIEVGDKFKYKVTQTQFDTFKSLYGYEPFFKVGEKYFHYSDARNYAATFAKNDWCFQPDADEVVEWDIDKVRANLKDNDHYVYRFCFAHNPDGSCALEFTHSKFYRKSKLHWTHRVHEVHSPLPGQNPKPPFFCDFIYHHHYQLPTENRVNYPCNLELSILDDPNNDRNVYYLGREYFWLGEHAKAVVMLENAVKLSTWEPEKGQAQIFLAQSYEKLGQ